MFVRCAQKRTFEIDTSDENSIQVFTESVFYVTIQTVPETLPIPIPKTVPKTIPIGSVKVTDSNQPETKV